jgi:hypothetical protein
MSDGMQIEHITAVHSGNRKSRESEHCARQEGMGGCGLGENGRESGKLWVEREKGGEMGYSSPTTTPTQPDPWSPAATPTSPTPAQSSRASWPIFSSATWVVTHLPTNQTVHNQCSWPRRWCGESHCQRHGPSSRPLARVAA